MNLQEMAPVGQRETHSPQRRHSRSLTMRTSILQARAQAPQCVHFFLSSRTPKTAVRLNSEYMAPSGQMKRQKGR